MPIGSESAPGRWMPWVDPLLLDWLLEGGGSTPAEQSAEAAVVLVDISGFTALTERLMRSAPSGAELVKGVLDRTFGALTSLVAAFGGRTLKFPGDAVLACWVAPEEGSQRHVQQAAVFALHAIPALNTVSLPDPAIRLTGRCGIVSGQVRILFVGGVNNRWECLVDGKPLHHLADAIAHATPGDILVSDDARLALKNNAEFELAPIKTGLHRLRNWGCHALGAGRDAYSKPSSVPPAPLPPSVLMSVPTAVSEHIGPADGPDGLAQFRLVTAMFVRLSDPLSPFRPIDDIQRDIERLQLTCARFGGVLNQAVVDDKGTVAVLGWGLLGSAHEDDATRAVLAALAIADEADAASAMSIGIATGRVFTGSRGGAERLEYAMIGHSVNVAARLMQLAGGGILCNDSTRAAARARIVFERGPTSSAAGEEADEVAYRPRRVKDKPHRASDGLVGRERELRVMLEAFGRLEAGQSSGPIVIEGEPGIGKSRLVAALVSHTQMSHVRSVIARGDPVERSSYHAWRGPLERLLGLNALTVDEQRSRLLQLLDQSRSAFAPLLGDVFGIPFVETEITRRMTPQGRADETRELLFHLFSNAVGNTPTLLVLEDAHWFDTGSWALADALASHLDPILCVVATRPVLSGDRVDAAPLMGAADVVRLQLDSLDQRDTIALACQCLDADSLPAELGALVRDKAGGHPFYIEQLVLALRDSGVVHVDRGACRLLGNAAEALSRRLPETVQGVVTSRVDRLKPSQQTMLKAASVLGLDFDLSMLAALNPEGLPAEILRTDLAAMVQLGLLTRNAAGGPDAYSFKHAITLQVTYELLPFAQRRTLHAAVARQYEREGSATHALLAHHWIEAAVPDKAFDHLVAAGEASLRGDANREAAEFFRQALRLNMTGSVPAEHAFQRARCHRLLAEALWVIGMFDEVPREVASCFRLLGGRERWVGSRYRLLATQLTVQAFHLLAGPSTARQHGSNRERRLELSRAAALLAMLRASPRDTVALLADSLLTLNLAEQAGSTNVLALGLLGYTADAVGLRGLSNTYFERARFRAQELGELNSYALALLFECMARFGAGDHVRAVAILDEGLRVARQLNDRRALARAADLLSVTHSFTFAEPATEAMRHVTDAIDSIRDRPVADRTYFLMTLRALSAQLLRPHDARSMFEPLESLVDPSLAHCTADAAALMNAATALYYTRQGNTEAAVVAADAAMSWARGRLRELPPSGWVLFEGTNEAYLGAAAAAGTPAIRRMRMKQARGAVTMLRRYARRCPVYGPRASHFEARLALVEHQVDRARKKWEQSLVAAEQLGLVLDEGRAHLHLAALTTDDRLRREHLARARTLFVPVRSDFFTDWVRQEEARAGSKGDR